MWRLALPASKRRGLQARLCRFHSAFVALPFAAVPLGLDGSSRKRLHTAQQLNPHSVHASFARWAHSTSSDDRSTNATTRSFLGGGGDAGGGECGWIGEIGAGTIGGRAGTGACKGIAGFDGCTGTTRIGGGCTEDTFAGGRV